MFGELSLFDPGPRTSTATAVTDAKLLSLGQEKLIPWLATNPNVSLQLLARLAQRLRRTNEAVGDLVFSDVPGRVAKALIDLGERFGKQTDEGLFVHHDLTQEELAEKCGTNKGYISKVENNLKEIRISTLQKIVELGLGGRLELNIKL